MALTLRLSEASKAELRYRMQGVAFMGAFFHAAPLMEKHDLTRERLFEGIRKQLNKKFGHLGERVVEDNIRVIPRGSMKYRHSTWKVLSMKATKNCCP